MVSKTKHAAAAPCGVSYQQLVDCARALPGVEEGLSYGTPALKVRGKLLARLREDNATVALKCSWEAREQLLAVHPEIFSLTDHYRNYPFVLLQLSTVDLPLLQQVLLQAWYLVAPKSLHTKLPAATL